MKKRRISKWLILAFLLTFLMPACALSAPSVMEELLWLFGSNPAVDVLQGEYLGSVMQACLLTAAPFVPVVCFILDKVGAHWAQRQRETSRPPEFASQEERREFYLKELHQEQQASHGTPWIVYAILCGLSVFLFGTLVLGFALPRHIQEYKRDLDAYRAGQPTIYEGPLQQVERQLRNGVREVPDARFVYYDSAENSLRCAVSLISQTQLMQESYTVAYLPETGTIVSITDADGNLRTAGSDVELPTPPGCWMYGDLAVPICDQVSGYSNLTKEQQALFDLLYSEVLSGGVAAGKIPTRSFDLPYPLKKAEFNAVLDLYESWVSPEQSYTHGYRTDDGRIVRQAYCYGITYAN